MDFALLGHAVVHEGDVRSGAGASEVLGLRRVDGSGRVVDVRWAPDVLARVAALVAVGFELEFEVGEGEGVAGVRDGDAVLGQAERAADEKEAVAVSGKMEKGREGERRRRSISRMFEWGLGAGERRGSGACARHREGGSGNEVKLTYQGLGSQNS